MNIVTSGTRNEGKSTLALWIAKEWSDTVILFDPKGTFRHVSIEVFNTKQLLNHLQSQDYLIYDENDDLVRALPLCYRVDGDIDGKFTEMSKALFPPYFAGMENDARISLVVDESWHLQGSNYINPELKRIVAQAPIDKICCIQCTHSISEWNTKTKSVMEEMFLFRQVGPRAKVLVTETCGEEVADIVCQHTFPAHHCVRYFFSRRPNDVQFEIWDNPKRWYIKMEGSSNHEEKEKW